MGSREFGWVFFWDVRRGIIVGGGGFYVGSYFYVDGFLVCRLCCFFSGCFGYRVVGRGFGGVGLEYSIWVCVLGRGFYLVFWGYGVVVVFFNGNIILWNFVVRMGGFFYLVRCLGFEVRRWFLVLVYFDVL